MEAQVRRDRRSCNPAEQNYSLEEMYCSPEGANNVGGEHDVMTIFVDEGRVGQGDNLKVRKYEIATWTNTPNRSFTSYNCITINEDLRQIFIDALWGYICSTNIPKKTNYVNPCSYRYVKFYQEQRLLATAANEMSTEVPHKSIQWSKTYHNLPDDDWSVGPPSFAIGQFHCSVHRALNEWRLRQRRALSQVLTQTHVNVWCYLL